MLSAAKVKPRAADRLEYPHANAPSPAALHEVAPGVYWLRMPLPFYGLRERVKLLHQHHAERLGELQRACDKPRTGAEAMRVLFKRALDSHQTLFAMGETLSHLNYLRRRGQLKRECGTDGIYRFTRN